jgi:Leucine-rich repeat (LRR) protein
MSWNKLKSLDKYLFKELTSLQYLNCQQNELTSLNSKIFSNLKNLIQLDFSQNKIQHLNKHMFDGLDDLEIIKFDHNEINGIFLKFLEQYFLYLNLSKIKMLRMRHFNRVA